MRSPGRSTPHALRVPSDKKVARYRDATSRLDCPRTGNTDARSPLEAILNRRGSKLYFVVAAVSTVLALLRYVVLARLLGPAELGIAATIVVIGTFFDQIADVGTDRFIIQDREGGDEIVQGLVQTVTVGRGLVVACALLVSAIPLAIFFRTPALASGLALLAVSPAISGFTHLDSRRAQRAHDFRADALQTIGGEVCGFIAMCLSAVLLQDFRAVVVGIIVRSLSSVVITHILAQRPYRLSWSAAHWPRLARFSIPLMANGLMVFAASQSDRLIVSHELGPAALGFYSSVLLLIYYPAALLTRFSFTLSMPLIANARLDPKAQRRAIDALGGQILLLAVVMAAGFALVAPVMVPVLFGKRFQQPALMVGLVGCLQTVRFLMNGPTTIAMATGRTIMVLVSNLGHVLAFVGALIGVRLGHDLMSLMAGFIIGEFLAVILSVTLVNRDTGQPVLHRLDRVASFLAACLLITGANLALSAGAALPLAGLAVLAAALATWLAVSETEVITQAHRMVLAALPRLSLHRQSR